jgi:large subunit ribosomal protein L17
MNNKTGSNRLSRKPSHRRALLRNLVKSLFLHEQIETTKAKAKEAARKAEKIITRAKVDTVHNRRLVARDIGEKDLVKRIFNDIAPRSANRKGGYTRILKLGYRQGDAAEMVVLALCDKANVSDTDDNKIAGKKKTSAKKETKESTSAVQSGHSSNEAPVAHTAATKEVKTVRKTGGGRGK